MPASILTQLADADILERSGARSPRHLRVSPRFLAYAEGVGGRLRLTGTASHVESVLEHALAGWDDYRGDAHAGARLLGEFMAENDQLGALLPVFPALENFALVAA